jgi:hypothetical protein
MAGPGVPEAAALVTRVSLNGAAAQLVSDHLTRVHPPPTELPTVSVSRLVNPGRAYYEVLHPLAEDLAVQQKRLAGSGAHELLEAQIAAGADETEVWLSGEEARGEPSLERITARVDACEVLPDGRRTPVEIKNVGSALARPTDEHLEQLGMYCALLDVTEGHILAVHRDDATGSSRLLTPWKVRYPDLGGIRAEMARRRDLLTEAVRRRDPASLPACPWRETGCRFRAAAICDCDRRSPLAPVIAQAATVATDPDFLAVLERRAAAHEARRSAASSEARVALWDVLTPRKVYFATLRARGAPPPEQEATPTVSEADRANAGRSLERVNARGLQREIFAAVRRSSGDRYRKVPFREGGLEAEVPTVEGRPFAVRVRQVRRPLEGGKEELVGQWGVPEDVRQLAVRASLVGATGGRVYVWNWRVERAELKLQVFDLEFDPDRLGALKDYATRLPDRLGEDLARGDHRDLPLCPAWMCPKCEFHDACLPERG